MINYRYKILKKLGEGGTGTVLLVEDSLTGQQVAMKVFATSSDRAINVDEVRKEFSTLVSLSHPNLIHVFNLGRIRQSELAELLGREYYTMEYLRGQDSLSYFSSMPMGERKILLLESLTVQALSALAYIHRQGIVHFDIKPHNLIVNAAAHNEEIAIKLTDFGFSTARVEAVDFPVRGTIEYTAPELLQGLAVDERLDLYSLGATLYHLWEGRCPFEAPNPVEVVKKALTEELPPLSRPLGPESRLPEVIEKLCRRSPEERYARASDALLEFNTPANSTVLKRSFALLRRPRFVGREKEKGIVEGILAGLDAKNQDRRIALVLSPEGMGKSAFLEETITLARSTGHLVLALKGTLSQQPLTSIARSLRHVSLELRSRGQSVPPMESPFGGLVDVDSDWTSIAEQFAGYSATELERLAEMSAQFLLRASIEMPLVVIVDDIERLDSLTLRALQSIVKTLKTEPVAVFVSATGDASTKGPLETASTVRIVLDELSEQDVVELVRSSFGDQVAQTEIPRTLHRLYGGIPLLLTEALHSLSEALPLVSVLDPDELTRYAEKLEEFLPAKLEDFFARRFGALSREELMLLQVLASFERPPVVEHLKRLVPMQSRRLTDYLELLRGEGHVDLLDQGRRSSIRHARLKKYLYDSIGDSRQKLHAFIAAEFAQIPDLDGWQDLGELARQHVLGGMKEKAAFYFETAGDEAVKQQALVQAIGFYQKSLAMRQGELTSTGDDSLREKLAKAYFASGSYKESSRLYQELLARSPEADARSGRLHTAIGKALLRLGENAEALHHFEEALNRTKDEGERFEVRQEIVALKIAGGAYDEAVRLCESQRDFALRQPDRELVAAVETNLGRAQFFRGNFEAAKASFTAAYEIYSARQNKQKTADALINLGNVLSVMRDFHGAIECWEKALELSKELGTLYQQAQIQNNLGIAHFRLQEFRDSRACYEGARQVFEELNSKAGLALTQANLGELASAEGDYERALECWEGALTLNREMNDTGGTMEALLQTALLRYTLGDLKGMHELLSQVERLLQEHDLTPFRGMYMYLSGLLLLSSSRLREARSALEEARESFERDADHEKVAWTAFRIAEAAIHSSRMKEALEVLKTVSDEEWLSEFPLLRAELLYHYGCIARQSPELLPEKPVVYFKKGMDLIEDEPIAEISWKLSFASGEEFARRGQREKAMKNYRSAELVIHHVLSLFKSPHLKKLYLEAGNKPEVLKKITAYQEQIKGEHRAHVEG